MANVQNGDVIKIHYKGTLNDGTLFDSSQGKDPLEFKVGSGMVIPGFDKGVLDMAIGDTKTINIPCAEAYGESNPENIVNMPRTEVPAEMNPQIGEQLQLTDDEGNIIPVAVTNVTAEFITLDANHPLAGKDLNFELELVSIN
jgi:FKBP-type peptidyl-prolyl cis-trans isomerase 2